MVATRDFGGSLIVKGAILSNGVREFNSHTADQKSLGSNAVPVRIRSPAPVIDKVCVI